MHSPPPSALPFLSLSFSSFKALTQQSTCTLHDKTQHRRIGQSTLQDICADTSCLQKHFNRIAVSSILRNNVAFGPGAIKVRIKIHTREHDHTHTISSENRILGQTCVLTDTERTRQSHVPACGAKHHQGHIDSQHKHLLRHISPVARFDHFLAAPCDFTEKLRSNSTQPGPQRLYWYHFFVLFILIACMK